MNKKVSQINIENTTPENISPLDTSQPGREEEVIKQYEKNLDEPSNNPSKQQSPQTGEKRYQEGLANNDQSEQHEQSSVVTSHHSYQLQFFLLL